MEVDKIYVSGLGKSAFGIVHDVAETPALIISDILGQPKKIDSGCRDIDTKNHTLVIFKNLEGLKVLEKTIKKIKKTLKQQEKIK